MLALVMALLLQVESNRANASIMFAEIYNSADDNCALVMLYRKYSHCSLTSLCESIDTAIANRAESSYYGRLLDMLLLEKRYGDLDVVADIIIKKQSHFTTVCMTRMAYSFYFRSQNAELRKCIDQLSQSIEGNDTAQILLALIDCDKYDYKSAFTRMDKIKMRMAGNIFFDRFFVNILYKSGMYSECSEYAMRCLSRNIILPQDGYSMHMYYSYSCMKIGLFRKALSFSLLAFNNSKDDDDLLILYCTNLISIGMHDTAVSLLSEKASLKFKETIEYRMLAMLSSIGASAYDGYKFEYKADLDRSPKNGISNKNYLTVRNIYREYPKPDARIVTAEVLVQSGASEQDSYIVKMNYLISLLILNRYSEANTQSAKLFPVRASLDELRHDARIVRILCLYLDGKMEPKEMTEKIRTIDGESAFIVTTKKLLSTTTPLAESKRSASMKVVFYLSPW